MREFLTCPVCGRCITGKNCRQNLRHHLLIHTGVKPFSCPHCPHRANYKPNLLKHIRSVHGPKLNIPIGTNINSPGGRERQWGGSNMPGVWQEYQREKQASKPPVPHDHPHGPQTLQIKAFYGRNKRQHLTNHLSTHTGEKPYGCPFCPHRSSRKDNLKMHIKLRHLNNLPSSMLGGDVTPRYQGHEGVLCGSTPRHKGCSNVPSLSQVLRWEEQETASALPHDDSHWGEALPLSSLSTPS
ncbi:hypothetical protein Pcinc_014500 [Petrolisthes cinctipes]|uniref:C2H2-type domain-containing protein n=1 Tax=Petrolisthes cinctipes TaxID=88211 RepID=A0AAE1G072_PETCI|nr:hypothetical protein Pcinc_014500 [Petrolisthes cinctipes]